MPPRVSGRARYILIDTHAATTLARLTLGGNQPRKFATFLADDHIFVAFQKAVAIWPKPSPADIAGTLPTIYPERCRSFVSLGFREG